MSSRLAGLDIDAAVAASHQEIYGDWYRDPWKWPEYDFAKTTEGRKALGQSPVDSSIEVLAYEVPKTNFGLRPASVFGPSHRLLYIASALALAKKYPYDLTEWVYGWRPARDSTRSNTGLVKNQNEWTLYQNSISASALFAKGVLQTDITSFFASIPVDNVLDDLGHKCGGGNALDTLSEIVRATAALPARSGLPQRSWASAIVANWYLRPVDELLIEAVRSKQVDSCSRWMDDIWLFGAEPKLRQVQVQLQGRLRELGLEINSHKTHYYEWSDAVEVIDEQGLTARRRVGEDFVVIASSGEAPGAISSRVIAEVGPLQARIFGAPELANTSTVRHVLAVLRSIEDDTSAAKWLQIAPRLPQSADALARYFRWAVPAEEYVEWFTDYVKSEWAIVPWAVAQLATALPAQALGEAADILESWLDTSLPVHVAVAAARIATAEPGRGREMLRSVAARDAGPFKRRILAYALLECGETRQFVRQLLSRDDRNLLTLGLLEDRAYRKVSIAKDFSGERTTT